VAVDGGAPSCAIAATTVWGALRAMETFAQTLARSSTSTISGAAEAATVAVTCAPLSVADSPRFAHRGLMVIYKAFIQLERDFMY
jgi:hypothetical protein